jgi:hypothetical protein
MKRAREDHFSVVNKRSRTTEDSKDELMYDAEPFTPAFDSLNLQEKMETPSHSNEFQNLLREVEIIQNWNAPNWSLVDAMLQDRFSQCLTALKREQFNLDELPLLNELLDCLNSAIITSRMSPNDRTLELSRLGLTRFPAPLLADPYYFEYWVTLETLVLSGNYLSWLPNEIQNLRQLESLYLDDNALIGLPSEISHLSELKVLDLRNNRFNYIPDEVLNLPKLQSLNISRNIIETPPNLSLLFNLRVLEAADNQLTTLPIGLPELDKLEWVDLKRNRLTEESLAVLQEKLGSKWYSQTALHQNESIFQDYLSNRF